MLKFKKPPPKLFDMLVGVQPLAAPTGSIYIMKTTYTGDNEMAVYHIKKDTVLTIRNAQLRDLNYEINELRGELSEAERFVELQDMNIEELFCKVNVEDNLRRTLSGNTCSLGLPGVYYNMIEDMVNKISILSPEEKKFIELLGNPIYNKKTNSYILDDRGRMNYLGNKINTLTNTANMIQKSIDSLVSLNPETVECNVDDRESLLKRYGSKVSVEKLAEDIIK